MENDNKMIPFSQVEAKIANIRGMQVIADADVAELYGVETREINQAVRNNAEKFPDGYIILLTNEDIDFLRSKILTTKISHKSRAVTKAFTEKGLYMLATILKGRRATAVTIAIIETFAKVRNLKRELLELHDEPDKEKQKGMIQHFGEMLTDIVMPDLQTSEVESSLEINFIIGKLKHTVKRVKKDK